MENKQCIVCNHYFSPRTSRSRFCADKCETRYETLRRLEKRRTERKIIEKACLICASVFLPHPRTPNQIYCSETCLRQSTNIKSIASGRKKEHYQNNKEKYREKKSLTDLEYKDKIRFSRNKKHVLERDGYKCTDCGKEKGLIVHHIDFSGAKETPNNSIENLTTLCRSCHMRHHAGFNNHAYIHITKEQILLVREESSSWLEVARKLGVDKTLLIKRRKQFGIF